MMDKHGKPIVVLTAILLMSLPVHAEIEIDWGAFVENDLRVNVDRIEEPGVGRNETSIGGDLRVSLVPDKLRFVGELKFVWIGFTDDSEYEGLMSRTSVSPYHLESRAVYLEVFSLLPGFDLRIGRQVVHWGAADMFSPTDNLNALDLEDPLMFGEALANEMIKVDFAPGDNFIFSGVFVPVFQPAMLPGSGLLMIADTSAEFPFVNPRTRLAAENLRKIWLRNEDIYIVDQPSFYAEMPDFSLGNSQFAFRVQWAAGLFDMSLSYYQGIDPMPVPVSSISGVRNTDEKSDSGTPKIGVTSDVVVKYPHKKVVGFDVAGQVPFLDDAGIWFEGAFIFPESIEMTFDLTDVVSTAKVIKGYTLTDTPFFKCTTGMDYSINQYLFVTGQYIHGFIDEFGADRINDYWMLSTDLRLAQDTLLIRFAVVGEFPHDDDDIPLDGDGDGYVDSLTSGATYDGTISSYVLFPQAVYKPVDGLELSLGGYFLLGHYESKFAMPAAGPSLVFFKARASF
jgi:hypothetical protein